MGVVGFGANSGRAIRSPCRDGWPKAKGANAAENSTCVGEPRQIREDGLTSHYNNVGGGEVLFQIREESVEDGVASIDRVGLGLPRELSAMT